MEAYALVVGESLVDIVETADGRTTERAGGSAANVAVALARLGRPVRFATSYADDARGHLVADHLAESGVELACDPLAVARTSTAHARVDEGGAASYTFDLDWRLNEVTHLEPLVVHVCSLGAVVAPGADAVLDLLGSMGASATVSYDVNARPAVTGGSRDLVDRVERVVAFSDLVKVSDEDLAALYPDLDVDQALAHLLGLGPVVIALTRGEHGATWRTATTRIDLAAASVDVVDTIGAGDTFAAALVDALWARGRLGAAARPELCALEPSEITAVLGHAARAAAFTVSRVGADPPYRTELG